MKYGLPRRFAPRNDINWSHCKPPTVIASRRRSNPSVVLHHLKYGLPRRYAPRNDGESESVNVLNAILLVSFYSPFRPITTPIVRIMVSISNQTLQ